MTTNFPAWRLRLLTLAAALACISAVAEATAASVDLQRVAERFNDSRERPVLGNGSQGPAVVRAQVLLDRAWFSPAEIDGRFGANLRRIVQAYQLSRGLQPSGRVDAATWAALEADSGARPPLAVVTVSDAQARGPYQPVPQDMMARAELKFLGYESVHEALAERYHMSPALLKQLNRGNHFAAGRSILVADVDNGRTQPAGAQRIEIDKSDLVMRVYGAQDRVVAAFPVSIGGRRDPLPVGRMKIVNEVQNPSFTYDPALLKDAKPGTSKAEIAAGPNNPVGNMWLGLSKPHWGIHGTPSPDKLGRAETNGCVHLTNWDAQRLSTLAKAGFAVDVRD